MSQSAVPAGAETVSEIPQSPSPSSSDRAAREFHYRPIPVLAPVSLGLGILSIVGLAFIAGLVLPLLGSVFGLVTLIRILRSRGELGGRWLAAIGFSLSAVFLITGASWHGYRIATEVPDGYERINFTRDISKKGFQATPDGTMGIHPDVQALDGRKIFIKGYMYPTGQMQGIRSFLLVKDNQQCCFGGKPNLTDMILVEMQDEKTVDYKNNLVSVAGVFRVRPSVGPAGLSPVYVLEGTDFERSRTSF